ncbi:hypothetical protein PT974_02457 [Cladobotryum mycophilum]|uniref:Myb-like domain-containing protein n=1 Tax=Cladobotryum mycophilum TaxID=491253 RepID=A0ABR0SY50_9HYPO
MNKNWNDRADKDLFFTILSVKNIGVISGAEWTTIGNHMRTLGYGFTNEGCRQHFQGLRRAQNKAESSGPLPESARRTDPTLNPITRRPGPGRGRPRKPLQPLSDMAPIPGAALGAAAVSQNPDPVVPGVIPGSVPGPLSGQIHDQIPDIDASGIPNGSNQPQNPQQAELQQPLPHPQPELNIDETDPILESIPNNLSSDHIGSSEPEETTPGDQLQLEQDQSVEDDTDEHPAKRQRLDTQELAPETTLDDEEAVLALAAHNGPDPVDPYPSDFNYAEA